MKAKSFLKSSLLAAATSAVLCLAPAAHAGTLVPTGYANGSQTFDLTIGGSNVSAGAFVGTFDSVPLTFWCAELTQTFSFGTSYVYNVSLPSSAIYTRLGQLFNEANAVAIVNTTNSAAFQLAVWEILFGNDNDLTTGSFKVTNDHGNSAAVMQANSWLGALGSFADTFDVFLLSNESHQDFITPGRPGRFVPEPTPLLLLGAALVVMMVATRRRVGKAPA